MNDNFKSLILQSLGGMGFHLSIVSSKAGIDEFLSFMYPVKCSYEMIRLGPRSDGGYVVPKDFDGIKACFSPGVSTESGFEEDCIRLGMRTHLADASVEAPDIVMRGATFEKKFISSYTGGDFLSIDDWIDRYEPNTNEDLLLQMDIEGAEYEVLNAISMDHLRRFRIIVIEFHLLHDLFCESVSFLVKSAIRKLTQTHAVVHLHPNNAGGYVKQYDVTMPRLLEVTLLRLDRFNESRFATALHDVHDVPNRDEHIDFKLGNEWLGKQ